MESINDKKLVLESTIDSLQKKMGKQAVQRLVNISKRVSVVSTGFPTLDSSLGIGGLPRGRICEILGKPTSGLSSLGLSIAKNAQKGGSLVLYFDRNQSFDPEYASLLGLNLDQLILFRGQDVQQSAHILKDAVINGGIGLIIIINNGDDQSHQIWPSTLDKVIAPLGHSETLLLFISQLPLIPPSKSIKTDILKAAESNTIFSHYSAVRLFLQRSGWIVQGKELEGYKTLVLILKNKLGPEGKEVELNIPIYYSKFFQYKNP